MYYNVCLRIAAMRMPGRAFSLHPPPFSSDSGLKRLLFLLHRSLRNSALEGDYTPEVLADA